VFFTNNALTIINRQVISLDAHPTTYEAVMPDKLNELAYETTPAH
jgi:hypothetical protein